MKKTIINSLLIIASLIVAIVLSEIVVRIVMPQDLTGAWFEITNMGLRVNKSEGSARHQLDRRIVHYEFFPPHLRETPLPHDEAAIKVLTLGDSFTFGWLLNKKDTYVSLLQGYADEAFGMNKFYFLNCAAGGWGTADYVAFVEDFGDFIKPNIILVFINAGDIGRSIKQPIFTFNNKYALSLKRNKLPFTKLERIVPSVPMYGKILENSHLVQVARKSALAILTKTKKLPQADIKSGPLTTDLLTPREDAIRLGQALFLRLKKWCDERNVLLLVTTTGCHNLKDAHSSGEPTKAFMSTAEAFFGKEKIDYFDVSSFVLKQKELNEAKFIIKNDGHPSEAGSKLIADTVWSLFLKRRLDEISGKNN